MGLIFSCPGIPAFCGRGRRGSQRRWTVRWLIGRKAGCKDRERERACNLSSRADFFVCGGTDGQEGRAASRVADRAYHLSPPPFFSVLMHVRPSVSFLFRLYGVCVVFQ